jgi:hypothetical protein
MDENSKSSDYQERRRIEKEEVLAALNVCGSNGVFGTFNDDIFLFDYWNFFQGVNYLIGVDRIDDYEDFCDDEMVTFERISTLEYDLYIQQETPHIINAFKAKQERLMTIWVSGAHPQSSPPCYYIEWALSKKIEIPWLQYAIDKGIYTPKQSNKEINSVEKPINARTENNYLKLILGLANGIKGFNPQKPYEAARLIKSELDIDLSEQAIAAYISKAYELESKKRQ